eukprot:UN16429
MQMKYEIEPGETYNFGPWKIEFKEEKLECLKNRKTNRVTFDEIISGSFSYCLPIVQNKTYFVNCKVKARLVPYLRGLPPQIIHTMPVVRTEGKMIENTDSCYRIHYVFSRTLKKK